jgi:hypothetical protein
MTREEENILIQKILNADWSRYENKKRAKGDLFMFFIGSNTWEVNFLIGLFRQQKIDLSIYQLIWVIKGSCQNERYPQPRTLVVSLIVFRISKLTSKKIS